MKIKLLTFLLSMVSTGLSAQQQVNDSTYIQPSIIGRLCLAPTGIVIEKKLFNDLTIATTVFVDLFEKQSEYVNDSEVRSYYPVYCIFDPRYYISLEERNMNGDRIDYYSGSFFGFPIMIELTGSEYSFGPVYGFQRTIGKRWYWNIGFGIGMNHWKGNYSISPVGEFGIGYIFY